MLSLRVGLGRDRRSRPQGYYAHDSLDARIRKRGSLGWREARYQGRGCVGDRISVRHGPTGCQAGEYLAHRVRRTGTDRFRHRQNRWGFETDAGFVLGSPAFTAPEVPSGAVPTVASDIYGLGAKLEEEGAIRLLITVLATAVSLRADGPRNGVHRLAGQGRDMSALRAERLLVVTSAAAAALCRRRSP